MTDQLERFFEHLISEFGKRGRRAVEFIRSGLVLREYPKESRPSKLAETIAYYVREALDELLQSADESESTDLYAASQKVVATWDHLEDQRDSEAEGEAQESHAEAVAHLGRYFAGESMNKRRLQQIFRIRTGEAPVRMKSNRLAEYLALRSRAAKSLHRDLEVDEAFAMLDSAVEVLRHVFPAPDEHLASLDKFCTIGRPESEDLDRLLPLLGPNVNHVRYFFANAVSPVWLDLFLKADLVSIEVVRSSLLMVRRLAESHGKQLGAWVGRLDRAKAGQDEFALPVALVASELGTYGRAVLLGILRRKPADLGVREAVLHEVLTVKADDVFVADAAEILLDDTPEPRQDSDLDEVVERLVLGANGSNAKKRFEILAGKCASSMQGEFPLSFKALSMFESLTDLRTFADEPAIMLARGLRDFLQGPASSALEVSLVLGLLKDLPGSEHGWPGAIGPRCRFRAVALAQLSGVSQDQLVDEVAEAIGTRIPTADDVALVDRAVREVVQGDYLPSWRAALGAPPSTTEIGKSIAEGTIDPEWARARLWSALLPEVVTKDWSACVDCMSGDGLVARQHFAERVQLDPREAGFADSPIDRDKLASGTVLEAAKRFGEWRPGQNSFRSSRWALEQAFEEVVADNALAWAERPFAVVGHLQSPGLVAAYFLGFARRAEAIAEHGPALVETVQFARTRPLPTPEPATAGPETSEWDATDEAGVALIRALVAEDVELGSKTEEAWGIIADSAQAREASSRARGSHDALSRAINRSCTRALDSAFEFVAAEFRRDGVVRDSALELLDEALALDGADGEEHRAIIAKWISFLRQVAPDWFEHRRDRLFGNSAPGDLGPKTLDLAIRWRGPDRWLLENYRDHYFRAAARGEKHAVEHLLHGMLWKLPEYEPAEVAGQMKGRGLDLVSRAGQACARILSSDSVPSEILEVGVAFWDAVLDSNPKPAALAGFAAWSGVAGLEQTEWSRRMRRTCEFARGRLARPRNVAIRAAEAIPSRDDMAILKLLLRGAEEPWHRYEVARAGLSALAETLDVGDNEPERAQLRTALIEAGYAEARDLARIG